MYICISICTHISMLFFIWSLSHGPNLYKEDRIPKEPKDHSSTHIDPKAMIWCSPLKAQVSTIQLP